MQGVLYSSNSRCKSVRVDDFLANPRRDPFRGALGPSRGEPEKVKNFWKCKGSRFIRSLDAKVTVLNTFWQILGGTPLEGPWNRPEESLRRPRIPELERSRKQSTTRKWPYRRFWPQILTEILTPNFDPGSAGEDLKEGGVFIGTKDRGVED